LLLELRQQENITWTGRHRATLGGQGVYARPFQDPLSHAYLADSSEQAADEFFPSYTAMMNAIGRERGWAPDRPPRVRSALCSPRGALLVGSPQEVIEKILSQHEVFGHKRFLAQITVGTLPHEKALRAIELLGSVVAPAVREEIARRVEEQGLA
jgi:alkanesulfonate monooxygenase SsuD/methylene tetrahydromethanopterin reductase-like flavin-dependent oxidoreductase (luciferase family)